MTSQEDSTARSRPQKRMRISAGGRELAVILLPAEVESVDDVEVEMYDEPERKRPRVEEPSTPDIEEEEDPEEEDPEEEDPEEEDPEEEDPEEEDPEEDPEEEPQEDTNDRPEPEVFSDSDFSKTSKSRLAMAPTPYEEVVNRYVAERQEAHDVYRNAYGHRIGICSVLMAEFTIPDLISREIHKRPGPGLTQFMGKGKFGGPCTPIRGRHPMRILRELPWGKGKLAQKQTKENFTYTEAPVGTKFGARPDPKRNYYSGCMNDLVEEIWHI